MTPPATHETRGTPERALVALAGALMLLASTRVTLPLVVFAVVVAVLALPMSSLIAWLSRFDARPAGGDDDGTFDEAEGGALDPAAAAAPDDVVTLARTPAEPLPRPIRPDDGAAKPHRRVA